MRKGLLILFLVLIVAVYSSDEDSIDYDFLKGQEDDKTSYSKAYVPQEKNKPSENDGIHVGGIDLSRSEEEVKQLKLPSSLEKKLLPYAELKGKEAQDILKSKPLSLSQSELNEIQKANERVVKDQFDKVKGKGAFDKLLPSQKTVLVSISSDLGSNLESKSEAAKNIWKNAVGGKWNEVQKALINDKSPHAERRKAEGLYLKKKEEEAEKREEQRKKDAIETKKREEENKRRAEEQKRKDEDERRKNEAEARKREEEAKRQEAKRQEDEKKRKQEEERKRQEDAKRKVEEDKKRAEEAKKKQEADARKKQEDEKKAQDEARKRQEEAKKRQDEETKKKQEADARKKQEDDKRAQDDAKKKQEEAKKKQEQEAKKKEAEEKKKKDDAKPRDISAFKPNPSDIASKKSPADLSKFSLGDSININKGKLNLGSGTALKVAGKIGVDSLKMPSLVKVAPKTEEPSSSSCSIGPVNTLSGASCSIDFKALQSTKFAAQVVNKKNVSKELAKKGTQLTKQLEKIGGKKAVKTAISKIQKTGKVGRKAIRGIGLRKKGYNINQVKRAKSVKRSVQRSIQKRSSRGIKRPNQRSRGSKRTQRPTSRTNKRSQRNPRSTKRASPKRFNPRNQRPSRSNQAQNKRKRPSTKRQSSSRNSRQTPRRNSRPIPRRNQPSKRPSNSRNRRNTLDTTSTSIVKTETQIIEKLQSRFGFDSSFVQNFGDYLDSDDGRKYAEFIGDLIQGKQSVIDISESSQEDINNKLNEVLGERFVNSLPKLSTQKQREILFQQDEEIYEREIIVKEFSNQVKEAKQNPKEEDSYDSLKLKMRELTDELLLKKIDNNRCCSTRNYGCCNRGFVHSSGKTFPDALRRLERRTRNLIRKISYRKQERRNHSRTRRLLRRLSQRMRKIRQTL